MLPAWWIFDLLFCQQGPRSPQLTCPTVDGSWTWHHIHIDKDALIYVFGAEGDGWEVIGLWLTPLDWLYSMCCQSIISMDLLLQYLRALKRGVALRHNGKPKIHRQPCGLASSLWCSDIGTLYNSLQACSVVIQAEVTLVPATRSQ